MKLTTQAHREERTLAPKYGTKGPQAVVAGSGCCCSTSSAALVVKK